MDIGIVHLEEPKIISGFSTETTLENNAQDLYLLYNDFLHNGKREILNSNTKKQSGVLWCNMVYNTT